MRSEVSALPARTVGTDTCSLSPEKPRLATLLVAHRGLKRSLTAASSERLA